MASYGSYCRCCRKFQQRLLYLNTFHKVIRLIMAFQETGFCWGCVLEQSPSRPYAPGTSSIYIINEARTHEDFRLATASNDLVMNMPIPSSSTSKLEHELNTAPKQICLESCLLVVVYATQLSSRVVDPCCILQDFYARELYSPAAIAAISTCSHGWFSWSISHNSASCVSFSCLKSQCVAFFYN